MSVAPLFFVSHGSPMFAVGTGEAADNLAKQSKRLDSVQAILVISPHWITHGNVVSTNEQPETVHDFGGFPDCLYRLQYPALGSGYIGHKIISLLQKSGLNARADDARGWDHGAWVPLLHLYPKADKPVVQVSLNTRMSMDELDQLGQVLNQLRKQNIAVICSGSLTHNLYDMSMIHDEVAEYAIKFEGWAREKVLAGNLKYLKEAHIKSVHYNKSHPTSEHFLPLLIAMAASNKADTVGVLKSPILHRTISMESYVWSRNDE
jgi:4,5-DOPA dioxygenase extradiol